MEALELMVEERTKVNKRENKDMRKSGGLLGIIYGKKMNPVPISLDKREFLQKASKAGENTIFKLIMKSDGRIRHFCILKNYQIDPVTRNVIHVDFLGVEENEYVRVQVPLMYKGFYLDHIKNNSIRVYKDRIYVRLMADKIPPYISIDVSEMKINDVLYGKDLKLPEGIIFADVPEKVICTLRRKTGKGGGMLLEPLSLDEEVKE